VGEKLKTFMAVAKSARLRTKKKKERKNEGSLGSGLKLQTPRLTDLRQDGEIGMCVTRKERPVGRGKGRARAREGIVELGRVGKSGHPAYL